MRWFWLVVLGLAGCDVVLSLDRPDATTDPDGRNDPNTVQVRTVFEAATPSPTTTFSFPLDSRVQSGDQLLAIIQGPSDNTILTMAPGWTNLIDDLAGNCPTTQWHYWVLRATASEETKLTFVFDKEDNYAAVVAAYEGAGDANVVDHEAPMQMTTAQNVTFPPATAALGSRIWFGAVADQPWTAQSTPVGTMPLRSLQDIATYDLPPRCAGH